MFVAINNVLPRVHNSACRTICAGGCIGKGRRESACYSLHGGGVVAIALQVGGISPTPLLTRAHAGDVICKKASYLHLVKS